MPRIVVGVSGASGMPLIFAVLRALAEVPKLEVHLVVSAGARSVLHAEGAIREEELHACARHVYDPADMAAGPASGSWQHDGMLVCPCSMSTLACIALGTGQNLLHRVADVCLKERRPLVLSPRETPLSLIHLKNMQRVCEAGGIVMPFCPAFYIGQYDLSAQARHFAGRVLDQMGIENNLCQRWAGG
ncbi:MAG: UbiX family flavin prenyltransferase [Desulfovibrio sp.]|nr:UbiX family flavin prenyltransferase [Desulfovibrio sp.]